MKRNVGQKSFPMVLVSFKKFVIVFKRLNLKGKINLRLLLKLNFTISIELEFVSNDQKIYI